jgi:hypothetical protein
MPEIAVTLRVAVALVLLAAAGAKARRLDGFRDQTLPALGVPRRARPFVAWAVVAVEGTLGIAGILGFAGAIVPAATVGLTAGFAGLSVFALATGRSLPCNCFGDADRRLGRHTLVDALALFAAAVYAWLAGAGTAGLSAPELAAAFLVLATWIILRAIPQYLRIWRDRRYMLSLLERSAA